MAHCGSRSNRKSRKEAKKEAKEHKEKAVRLVENTLNERKKNVVDSGR